MFCLDSNHSGRVVGAKVAPFRQEKAVGAKVLLRSLPVVVVKAQVHAVAAAAKDRLDTVRAPLLVARAILPKNHPPTRVAMVRGVIAEPNVRIITTTMMMMTTTMMMMRTLMTMAHRVDLIQKVTRIDPVILQVVMQTPKPVTTTTMMMIRTTTTLRNLRATTQKILTWKVQATSPVSQPTVLMVTKKWQVMSQYLEKETAIQRMVKYLFGRRRRNLPMKTTTVPP